MTLDPHGSSSVSFIGSDGWVKTESVTERLFYETADQRGGYH